MNHHSNAKPQRCSGARQFLFIFILGVLCVSAVRLPAHAQGVTFLATWQNAYFRSAPSVNAPTQAPLVQGALFSVVGRTEDNQWLALSAPNFTGWLPAGFGEVDGDLSQVPAVKQTLPPFARNTNTHAYPDWITLGPRAKALYQQAIKSGRDGRMFTIAGDSNSTWQRNTGRIAAGNFSFAGINHLRSIVTRFDPSFARVSAAVGGGLRAADMFDPAMSQATSKQCQPDEGMFPCELRLSNASIVFIQLGTGDKFVWRDYEANVRRMIEHALANNVLPVLVTKADDLESIQGGASFNFINDTLRRLAAEYQLPLEDFHAASRTLPTVPNPELPKRPFTQYGLHDEWGYYFHLTDEGYALRVRTTLMMLDVITRGL
jgi:hypothetical protein